MPVDRMSVEEICRRLRPIFGEKIDSVYLKYRLADTPEARLEIETALNALYHKHLESILTDRVLLEPPPKNVVSGEYPIGKVNYADKDLYTFALREQDWARHMCVSGMSGSGKTMLAYQVIGNLILKEKPFLVFDWKKSFRPLMLVDDSLLCFTIGNNHVSNLFKLNINEPPEGVDPKEWINTLSDLITESFMASYGVHKVVSELLDKAFREFGVYKGSKNYPTWHQIKDRLEEQSSGRGQSSREGEWVASALRIAHVLTFGAFGEAINYKDKDLITIPELMDKNVIFELHTLNNSEKKFFASYILTYIYKMKKASAETKDSFEHAIIVDEAHNIFLKEKTNFVSESITEMMFREIREYGISLICLDQHISKLSDVVSGNAACNIAFQQVLPQDVETISSLMQLREHRQYFSMLPVGHAIVKLAERYYRPFLIHVPYAEIKGQNVADQYVIDRMNEKIGTIRKYKMFAVKEEKEKKEVDTMENVLHAMRIGTHEGDVEAIIKKKPKPLVNHLQVELVGHIKTLMQEGMEKESIKEYLQRLGYNLTDINNAFHHVEPVKAEVLDDERKFLTLVKQFPNLATGELYKRLELSIRKCDKIKTDLLATGLIESVEERTEKGWKKRIRLTAKGFESLMK
ncbi:MAG: DUF87 domain-containing protein [Candidatus Woesearchaeota archaeon]